MPSVLVQRWIISTRKNSQSDISESQVVSDYVVKLSWEVEKDFVKLDDRIVFIGDSNLTDSYETCWSYILKAYYKKFTFYEGRSLFIPFSGAVSFRSSI